MNDELYHIASLIKKHIREELTESEKAELNTWLNGSEANRKMFDELNDPLYISGTLKGWEKYNDAAMVSKIAAQVPGFSNDLSVTSNDHVVTSDDHSTAANDHSVISPVRHVHRVHFLKTAWFRYAAAIILIFGAATFIYLNNSNDTSSVATTINPVPVQNDVAPGGNRATLTLADGSKIILDSAANGKIAQQSNATITKKGDQVVYSSHLSPLTSDPVFNTMTTPRGGQYQLTLPDGSQVWLNAESSITYPTAFTGKERRVAVTGEAYFEVAKNKSKPFIVTTHLSPLTSDQQNQRLEIEVLGTHFNVNTYKEEPTNNVTLLEGAVKLTSHLSLLTSHQPVLTSLTLRPGQQGQLSNRGLSLAANPDVEQVMAWKNGLFNFNNKTLEESLRQLARWYDVDVIFQGKKPNIKLAGTIGRKLTLSQVLKGLSAMELKTRLDAAGKKLIILE